MPHKIKKIISLCLVLLFFFQQTGFAQIAGQLDISGYLASLRSAFAPDAFRPLHLRYLSYNPIENNFQLFLDKGSLKNPSPQELEDTTKILLNYFFVGVALPNDTFWVNLRPDAEDQIIDDRLAQTDVGKIMLETDLQLKKDTAKFTSPETPEGREYWDKLYKKAGEIFGYDNITIPTLTRPWIVPDEVIISETNNSAYIYKATLKVMLEQDYLKDSAVYNFEDKRLKELNEYSSQLIREIIIPKLTKEINSSKRYASLRQVYYSLIMAQWFKVKFQGEQGKYYELINSQNLQNLSSKEPWSKTTYFKAYQKSFKDGEYNIQQPVYTPYGQTIRSYFSGGELIVMPMPLKIGEEARNPETDSSTIRLARASSSIIKPNIVTGVKVKVTDAIGELGEVKIEEASSNLTRELKSTSSAMANQKGEELDIDDLNYSQFYTNNSLEKVMETLNALSAEKLKAQNIDFVIRTILHLVAKVRRDKEEVKELLVKDAINQLLDKVVPEMRLNSAYDELVDFIYNHFYYRINIHQKATRKESLAIVYPHAKLLLNNTSLDLIDLLLSDNQFSLLILKMYARAAGIIMMQRYNFLQNTENSSLISNILDASSVDTNIELGFTRLAKEECQLKDQFSGGMSNKYEVGKDFLRDIKDSQDVKILFQVLFHEIGHNILHGQYESNEAKLLFQLLYWRSYLDFTAVDEFFAHWVTKDLSNHMGWSSEEFFKFLNMDKDFESAQKNGYEAGEQHEASRAQIKILQAAELDLSTERLLETLFKVLPSNIAAMSLSESEKKELTELADSYIQILKDNGREFLEPVSRDFEKAEEMIRKMQSIIGKIIPTQSKWLFEILVQCFPGVRLQDVSIEKGGLNESLDHSGGKKINRLTSNTPDTEKLKKIMTEFSPHQIAKFLKTIRLFVPVNISSLSSPIEIQRRSADSTMGGIDFRNLPIVTQAIGNLNANISSSLVNRLNSLNLNSEWREIENLVNSGITPSAERIKEYIQASCYKESIGRDIDKVISCISDILRIEEERYSPTDPTLKDILVVLDSANSVQQLKAVFIGTAP